MIIEISDEWRVRVEPMNFILEQYREVIAKNKPPRMDWKFVGYYASLEQALLRIPHHLMQSGDLENIAGLPTRWESLIAQFSRRVGKAA